MFLEDGVKRHAQWLCLWISLVCILNGSNGATLSVAGGWWLSQKGCTSCTFIRTIARSTWLGMLRCYNLLLMIKKYIDVGVYLRSKLWRNHQLPFYKEYHSILSRIVYLRGYDKCPSGYLSYAFYRGVTTIIPYWSVCLLKAALKVFSTRRLLSSR